MSGEVVEQVTAQFIGYNSEDQQVSGKSNVALSIFVIIRKKRWLNFGPDLYILENLGRVGKKSYGRYGLYGGKLEAQRINKATGIKEDIEEAAARELNEEIGRDHIASEGRKNPNEKEFSEKFPEIDFNTNSKRRAFRSSDIERISALLGGRAIDDNRDIVICRLKDKKDASLSSIRIRSYQKKVKAAKGIVASKLDQATGGNTSKEEMERLKDLDDLVQAAGRSGPPVVVWKAFGGWYRRHYLFSFIPIPLPFQAWDQLTPSAAYALLSDTQD